MFDQIDLISCILVAMIHYGVISCSTMLLMLMVVVFLYFHYGNDARKF